MFCSLCWSRHAVASCWLLLSAFLLLPFQSSASCCCHPQSRSRCMRGAHCEHWGPSTQKLNATGTANCYTGSPWPHLPQWLVPFIIVLRPPTHPLPTP